MALDVARAVALASTAVALGAVLFLTSTWTDAAADIAGPLRRLLGASALAGLASSLAALALESDLSALQSTAWIAGAAAWVLLALWAVRRAKSAGPQRAAGTGAAIASCAVLV